jgi:hypothetical protein
MNKKVILSALGGGLTLFIVGGLLFEFLLKGAMADMIKAMGSVYNQNPNFVTIALAQLVLSLILAIFIYKSNVTTFMGGLTTGTWMTFLILFWFDLWMLTTFNFMTVSMALFDTISNTVIGAVAGGVIGWIQGKVN